MASMPKREVDETDFKIVCALKDNGRLSYKALGKIVSLSPSSTFERTRKLEEKNIIKGYSTDIDWSKFGYALHAFILLKEDKVIGSQPDFLRERDEVFNCWTVAGEYDYLLEVYVADNQELGHFMNYLYHSAGRTYTLLILDDLFKHKK